MAKIVLAGPSNDPYFPRCELLADQLKTALPNFEVHKIFIQPSNWEEWLQNTCSKFGWRRKEDSKGPIVWRELVSRGGKAALIGDSNDFQEFCRTYYNIQSSLVTNYMLRVAGENQLWTDIRDDEEQHWAETQNPVVISFWNAYSDAAQMIAGKIAIGGVLPYGDMEFRLAAAPWMLAAASRPSNETSEGPRTGAASSVESIIGGSSSFVEQLAALETIQANIENMACGAVRRVVNCGGNAISSAVGAKLIIIAIDDSCNNDSSLESFRALGRDLENTLTSSKPPPTDTWPKPDTSIRVLFVASSVECMSRTLFRVASYFVAGILSTAMDDMNADPFTVNYESVKDYQFFVNPAHVLCLTTPLENAAKSLVAKQLNVKTSNLQDLFVWSRPESQATAFPWPFYVDMTQSTVSEHRGAIEGPTPYTRMVMSLLAHERKFITGIHEAVSARYVVAAGKTVALSHAATDFLRGWFGGAEKHPDLLIEQHRRDVIFSVGICNFTIPANAHPTPTSADGEQPKDSMICFRSVPIRFTGRDNLDNAGYSIMQEISPPAEMFVVPQAPKPPEVMPSSDEIAPTTADTLPSNPADKPAEEVSNLELQHSEDGGQGEDQPLLN